MRVLLTYVAYLVIKMDSQSGTALKRQILFLIGGTITGAIMTYYLGFVVTILVNSIIWYMTSYIVYRFVWKKNSLIDQTILLSYFRNNIRPRKYASY
jgi:hypothetical protein